MIDPKLFTVERLLHVLVNDDTFGNHDVWRKFAEIIPNYRPPYAKPDERPICVVRYDHPDGKDRCFLRHSKGPHQGHDWDVYGDDYLNPELALIALCQAPVPPFLLDKRLWEKRREYEKKNGKL